MAPIRSSTSIRFEHSSQQVLVAGVALARDMLVSGIIDVLLTSGILVEGARTSTTSSSPRQRRRVSPDYAPRPSNPWILFRSDCVVELKKRLEGTAKRYDSVKFNRELSKHWNSLPEAQQEPYRIMALEAIEAHRRLYPDYKYQPKRGKKQRGRGKGKKNVEVETVTVAPEAMFVPHIVPEPGFTINLPELTVNVPGIFASDLPPSNAVTVQHRFQFDDFNGTAWPSTYRDDLLINPTGLVGANTPFLYSSDSPVAHSSSSHGLEQGPLDWVNLYFGYTGHAESPGSVTPMSGLNDLIDLDLISTMNDGIDLSSIFSVER